MAQKKSIKPKAPSKRVPSNSASSIDMSKLVAILKREMAKINAKDYPYLNQLLNQKEGDKIVADRIIRYAAANFMSIQAAIPNLESSYAL